MFEKLSQKAVAANDRLHGVRETKVITKPSINVVRPEEIAALVERVVTAEGNAARAEREAELARAELKRYRHEMEPHRAAFNQYAQICIEYEYLKRKFDQMKELVA